MEVFSDQGEVTSPRMDLFSYFLSKHLKLHKLSLFTDKPIMKNEWVYYLNLSSSLDSNFLNLDSELKEEGLSLVPINLEDMTGLTRSKMNLHVVIIVDKLSKYKYFNMRVRKLMRFLLRRDTINFYILSSFENVNDKAYVLKRKNYFFTPLPVSIRSYAKAISAVITVKDNKVNTWPGARRRVHPSGGRI